MFGIGSTELLVILLVALMVLGPKSLAGFARKLGKFIGEFRRVSTDFQRTLNLEAAEEEARQAEEKRRAEAGSKSDAAPKNSKENASCGIDDLPPDSPLGRAVAKARADAEAAEREAARAVNLAKSECNSAAESKKEQSTNGA